MYTIVTAQNLSCMPSSSVDVGLYSLLSYLNHSCDPNAVLVETDDVGTQALVALRPIAAGEEVAFAYVRMLQGYSLSKLPRRRRRKVLLAEYGFTCVCPKCTNVA